MLHEIFQNHLLTAITFLPAVGAILLYCIPFFNPKADAHGDRARVFTLVMSLATFVLSLLMLTGFNGADAKMQFVEKAPWIVSFGSWYSLGVD